MTRDVETVAPDSPLQKAAEAMEAIGVGSLLCDGRRLVGTITDRDIVVRGVATGRSPVGLPGLSAVANEAFPQVSARKSGVHPMRVP